MDPTTRTSRPAGSLLVRTGAAVKRARDAARLTQSDLARRVGRSQQYVSAIESGRIDRIAGDTGQRIADCLQVSPTLLFVPLPATTTPPLASRSAS